MTLKEELQNLSRKQLLSIYSTLEPEATDVNKLNTNSLINKILEKEEEQVINLVREAQSNAVITNATTDSGTPSHPAGSLAELRALQRRMKDEALRKVIVTVTPADSRDVDAQTETVPVSIDNEHFAASAVVPFNYPCEVEYCIAEYLRNAMSWKNVVLDTTEQKKTGRYSKIVRVPKYNVIIQEKDQFRAK